MIYFLMHKENPVLSFELSDDYSSILISDVFNQKLVPVGINKEDYKTLSTNVDEKKFFNWWKNRTIPTGRKNLERALKILKVSNVEQLIEKTHSLNLTDHYWIKKQNDNVKWNDINYFDNKFDDSIGEFLLLNKERTFSEGTYNSPDLFTDGMLPKKWIERNGEFFLLKGSDSAFQQEPFNEALASYICYKLNIRHAEYEVKELINDDDEKEFYSLCKNFVTKNTELISAYDISKIFKKTNNESVYQHFFRCCSTLGINDVEEDIQKMLVVDFIMANTDRHLRNFGFLRDSDSLEWIGLAPVYDTEKSLFLNKALPKKSYAAINIQARPFKDNQAEQFNLLNKSKLKELPFEKLKNAGKWFNELLKNNEYISAERRAALCENLMNRISSIDYLIKNEQKIFISKGKHKRDLDLIQGISIAVLESF